MPSLRKRVSSYFRQLSFYNEPRERKHNINENSFVTKYLEGHISIKEGPPILYGKNPTDLPNYDLGLYDVGPTSVVGCYSGPNGGLTTVKRLEKHLSVPDTDIDFIDTQDEPEAPVSPPVLHKSPVLSQSKQTVDNTTMLIKVAGQEYLVTNRKKHESKSQSLGSLSDLEVEIEKTKIFTNNNNSDDVKCKNQELANAQGDPNESVAPEPQKPADSAAKKTAAHKGGHSKRSSGARRKSKSPERHEAPKVSYDLAKSKSEGNPFQHKKKGKIIRISNRPTAHADDTATGSDSIPNTVDPILPEAWSRRSDHIYGISDSLYDRNQVTKNKNGYPIADCFGIIARNDSAILAVADGVNWGEKASIAAKSAVHGCLHYLDKTIFNDTKPFDDLATKNEAAAQKPSAIFSHNRISNTREVFVCLLRAFNCAHDLILENEGMLTTLTVAVVLPLKPKNVKVAKPKERGDSLPRDKDKPNPRPGVRDSGRNFGRSDEASESYICCVCNVGDTLAYVYSQKYGVRELTKGSHDVNCNRDMRDALGALGPVDGINPELSNLTLSVTVVQKGDIILVASDGLTDNFDPNVCKFTVNSKETTTRLKRPSTARDEHHNKENVNLEKSGSSQEVPSGAADTDEDKGAKVPVKPPRKNRDSASRSSRERSVDSLEASHGASKDSSSHVEQSQISSSSQKTSDDKSNIPSFAADETASNNQTSGKHPSDVVKSQSSATNDSSNELDNPLVAQFLRENSLDDQSHQPKPVPDKKSSLEAPRKTSTTKKPSSHSDAAKSATHNPKVSSNQPKVHVHKTASRNIPLNNKTVDLKRSSSRVHELQTNKSGFLRSKTSLDMRTSARTILRNEDGIPFVTPLQRYEISLLLMEDILKHGISGHDSQCVSAKRACENLVSFTFSISSAKRHTLEDADLYFDNVNGVLVEVSQQEKKVRRRKGLERVQNLPGKLDHVSIVAYNVGNFGH